MRKALDMFYNPVLVSWLCDYRKSHYLLGIKYQTVVGAKHSLVD